MRDGRLREIIFADGEYDFRLAWGQLVELQELCNAGPYVILNRLQNGEWRVEDIAEVIRLGLLGADDTMKPTTASTLVKRYVKDRPPLENLFLATVILQAGLMGAPEEPVGEQKAASPENPLKTSQMEKSDLPPSMEPARSSAGRRKKSTK